MTISRIPFRCVVCASELFIRRRGQQPYAVLICDRCGYVHHFLNNAIELWKPEDGYPAG